MRLHEAITKAGPGGHIKGSGFVILDGVYNVTIEEIE